ncbi:MAG: DUF839 domain-containing protein [Planctomycetes bacterium]|nr:DUF839 domain-containing protein [Planctomycetota bacterium]
MRLSLSCPPGLPNSRRAQIPLSPVKSMQPTKPAVAPSDPSPSRRDVLKVAAGSALGALIPACLQWRLAPADAAAERRATGAPFTPIAPTTVDDFVVAPELRVELLASEGDALARDAAGQIVARVGGGCDFTAFLPIDVRDHAPDLAAPHRGFVAKAASSREGLLVVNHEGLTLQLFHADWQPGANAPAKSDAQILAEQRAVGLSVLHVRRDERDERAVGGTGGGWRVVAGSRFSRRLDANTPHQLTGPAANLDGGPTARGTLANCSGGITPWGTVLSCEENFHEFASELPEFVYRWPKEPYATKRHWGWVVEVDPFDPNSTPRKHTALGRFRHENVAIRVGADGTLVAYMGDDKNDSCLYKFVAAGKVTGDRARDMALLESGRLYVAQLEDPVATAEPASGERASRATASGETVSGSSGAAKDPSRVSTRATRGRWLLLDLASQQSLSAAKKPDGTPQFASQAEVLADVLTAAQLLGGTPLERPEDAEIHPHDGSLYVALTNQKMRVPADLHGRIARLEEDGGDPASLAFSWSIFAEGGQSGGFSCPDNLAFDANGDLWVTSDITSAEATVGRLAKPDYAARGNNGLFFFRTRGPMKGVAFQAASGPVDCELTGPCFTPDGTTLFLSVQHPGEESSSREQLTSHWPRGGSSVPQSAVVAIRGFLAGG